jgi:hypothetical protein
VGAAGEERQTRPSGEREERSSKGTNLWVATVDGGFGGGGSPDDGEPATAVPSPAYDVWRRRAGGGAARRRGGVHRLGKRCHVEGPGGGVGAEVRMAGERCRVEGWWPGSRRPGGVGGGAAAAWMRGCTEEKKKR